MKRKKQLLFYILRKIVLLFLSVMVLSITVFCLSRLTPIDPLQAYYGESVEKMSQEEKEAARQRLGLNDPIPLQYFHWLSQGLQGDFGISYQYKQNVGEVISQRAGNTLLLGGVGFLIIFSLSILLGIACAWQENSLLDRAICKIGTLLNCIPEFWMSLLLLLVFSVTLRIFPSSGAYCIGHAGDLGDRIHHLVLPETVIVASHLWYYAYIIRSRLVEEAKQDYVLLCKAKGLKKRDILLGHCLRNSLPAYLSMMAIAAPHILTGTYIVETVFSYPGLGALTYQSARYGDYNLLMVLCLLTGAIVLFFNLLGQAISQRLDPRMRGEKTILSQEVSYVACK